MSVDRLRKQLVRELKASPKKAAVLGLLVLVALYFWAPLLENRGQQNQEAQHPAAAVAATTMPTMETMPANTSEIPVTWRELASWIASDARMAPSMAVLTENPLGEVERPPETDDEPEAEQASIEDQPAITPDSLGLQLTGTVVGGRRRVAIVNGRPYAEGRDIELPGGIVFRVVEVSHKRAVLERESERFVLTVETMVSAAELSGGPLSPP